MHFLHILLFGCSILGGTTAYFTAEQLEQIEQKYESPSEEEQEYFNAREQSAIQETLNQAFSQLEPSQVKGLSSYGSSSGGQSSSYGSGLGTSSSASDSLNGLKSLEGKSSEYSKVTHIPSGSLFAMPAGKGGQMEFESPYSKEPYSIVFRTHSMPVKIKQQHQTLPAPEVEFVRTQEDPHRIKHEVVRPVIQEVHEVIQPYRRVVQEVRPVQESIHTIVSKGEPRGGRGGGNGGGALEAGGNAAGGRSSAGYGRSQQSLGGGGGGGGLSIDYSEQQPIYSAQKAVVAPVVTTSRQQVQQQQQIVRQVQQHQHQPVHHHHHHQPQHQFTRQYLLPAASQYSPQFAIPQYVSFTSPSSTREMPTHYSPRYLN